MTNRRQSVLASSASAPSVGAKVFLLPFLALLLSSCRPLKRKRTPKAVPQTKRQSVKILKGHKQLVIWVAMTQDGRRAISGFTDKTVRVWDLESGAEVFRRVTDEPLRSVGFDSLGRVFVTGGAEAVGGELTCWDVGTGAEVLKLRGQPTRS